MWTDYSFNSLHTLLKYQGILEMYYSTFANLIHSTLHNLANALQSQIQFPTISEWEKMNLNTGIEKYHNNH